MNLFDIFEQYRKKRLRGQCQSAVNQFNVTLKLFRQHLGHEPTLDDLNDDVVTNFVWTRVESGISTATARKNGKNLCALWRFACRQNLKSTWPDVDLPPAPERIPIAWTRPQLAKLFQACENEPGYVGQCLASEWWHALHSVLWDTGERISAVLSIRWTDIDIDSGWLVIPAESRKGGTRDKSWQLHADTVASLEKIKWPERELIFFFPYTTLYHRYQNLLKRAGLPHSRKHKFHCLRKSVGSYFEAAGEDATELLGHSSRAITKAYLDPRIVQKKQASEVLFRPSVEQQAVEHPVLVIRFKPDPTNKRLEQFCVNGKWHDARTSDCDVLRLLTESPEPVTHVEIERAVGRKLTENARANILHRVKRLLREAAHLPAKFNPVPSATRWAGEGNPVYTTWSLQLPST